MTSTFDAKYYNGARDVYRFFSKPENDKNANLNKVSSSEMRDAIKSDTLSVDGKAYLEAVLDGNYSKLSRIENDGEMVSLDDIFTSGVIIDRSGVVLSDGQDVSVKVKSFRNSIIRNMEMAEKKAVLKGKSGIMVSGLTGLDVVEWNGNKWMIAVSPEGLSEKGLAKNPVYFKNMDTGENFTITPRSIYNDVYSDVDAVVNSEGDLEISLFANEAEFRISGPGDKVVPRQLHKIVIPKENKSKATSQSFDISLTTDWNDDNKQSVIKTQKIDPNFNSLVRMSEGRYLIVNSDNDKGFPTFFLIGTDKSVRKLGFDNQLTALTGINNLQIEASDENDGYLYFLAYSGSEGQDEKDYFILRSDKDAVLSGDLSGFEIADFSETQLGITEAKALAVSDGDIYLGATGNDIVNGSNYYRIKLDVSKLIFKGIVR